MMTNISQKAVLITFPPSLDSELARFLLKHYGIEQQERPHALIFCFFVTLWHARTIIFPVLWSNSFKLIGPRPMAEYLIRRARRICACFHKTPGRNAKWIAIEPCLIRRSPSPQLALPIQLRYWTRMPNARSVKNGDSSGRADKHNLGTIRGR